MTVFVVVVVVWLLVFVCVLCLFGDEGGDCMSGIYQRTL